MDFESIKEKVPIGILNLFELLDYNVENKNIHEHIDENTIECIWYILDESKNSIGELSFFSSKNDNYNWTINCKTTDNSYINCFFSNKYRKDKINFEFKKNDQKYDITIYFGNERSIFINSNYDNYNFSIYDNNNSEELYYYWTGTNNPYCNNDWARIVAKNNNCICYEYATYDHHDHDTNIDEWERRNYTIHFEKLEDQPNRIIASRILRKGSWHEEIIHKYILNGILDELICIQIENFNHFRNAINELLSTKKDVISFLLKDKTLNDNFALLVPDVVDKCLIKEKRI